MIRTLIPHHFRWWIAKYIHFAPPHEGFIPLASLKNRKERDCGI